LTARVAIVVAPLTRATLSSNGTLTAHIVAFVRALERSGCSLLRMSTRT
jgi:uncharacterized protein with von Willebrand factor type A (vWA) domain